MASTLADNYWVRDIRGALIVLVISQFLMVWDVGASYLALSGNWRLSCMVLDGQPVLLSPLALSCFIAGQLPFPCTKLLWQAEGPASASCYFGLHSSNAAGWQTFCRSVALTTTWPAPFARRNLKRRTTSFSIVCSLTKSSWPGLAPSRGDTLQGWWSYARVCLP